MDDPQQDSLIQEAEIIEETSPTTTTQATPTSGEGAEVLLSLENLIKNNIASIDKLGEELKQLRNMFSDSFSNDPVYKENEEKAKEAAKVKNTTKQNLLKQPSVIQTADKIKTIAAELREKKNSLSDYLLEYQRMAGVNEIQGHDGEIREIINQAKLLKKSNKERK